MATYTEGLYVGDWLKGEADNKFSREEITVLAGSGAVRSLTTGMVLGKITRGAATVAAAGAGTAGANTGNGTLTMDATAPFKAGAQVGVYLVKCTAAATNNGTFRVYDPDGHILGDVTMAAGAGTFDGEIKFALADGSTDFAAGDGFSITVAAGSGKFVQLALTGLDGTQRAAGLLYQDASAADGADGKGVAIVRDAMINTDKIVWPAGASAGQKATALAELNALGIVAREGV